MVNVGVIEGNLYPKLQRSVVGRAVAHDAALLIAGHQTDLLSEQLFHFGQDAGRFCVRGGRELHVGRIDNQQLVSETHLAIGFGPEGAAWAAAHQGTLVVSFVARANTRYCRVAALTEAVALVAAPRPWGVGNHVRLLPELCTC